MVWVGVDEWYKMRGLSVAVLSRSEEADAGQDARER